MSYQENDIKKNYLTLDQVIIGQKFELKHTITNGDVTAFAALTGDYNPLHVDPTFSRETLFGKPVVHGMLTASYISTMIGMLIPGPGALWTSQTLNFLHPTYIDDDIIISATVKAKSNAAKMLTLEIEIVNQHNIKLISGESTVRMPEILGKKKDKIETLKNHNQSVDQKVILVTGGSRGIGAATANLLALKGHSVVINYFQSDAEANALVSKISAINGRAIAIKGNISNEEDVAYLFQKTEEIFGPIQAVIHCAAPTPVPQPFDLVEWSTFENFFNVQIKGAYNCLKYALPKMILAEDGVFIFLSSIFAEGVPPPQQSPYVTAKAALAAMARSLAVEYGPKGIRINIVSPGLTQTEMLANIPEKVKLLTKMNTPLRELASANDIALTIEFLISNASRHITGENIRVCGGIAM
jgi:3-oxoacyl-[acyl-carrier protein] reductase